MSGVSVHNHVYIVLRTGAKTCLMVHVYLLTPGSEIHETARDRRARHSRSRWVCAGGEPERYFTARIQPRAPYVWVCERV